QHFAKLQADFQEAGLSSEEWDAFRLRFAGDVDGILARRKQAIAVSINLMVEGDPSRPVDITQEPPSGWPYRLLVEERDKVKDEVGIDAAKQRRYADLQRSLEKDQRSLQRLVAECDNAGKADERKKHHIEHRRSLYVKVIQSYLDEQAILERLYSPLQ